ncbi:Chitotriosidase-1 [Colletotrichum sp. SAR 10_70]|nr:Chitotriosidase-1 [Colletotrichum sp. SAR 10_71]KAI8158816.1 Chitotriosidase-1 [Colletotrichum sp. SAR 10_70]KAI8207896.1 Chitotriosidase-1 [Colletotrichum sp. SAR 10_65]KAI8245924.1 Chitotriosidase-1 [Colletotrichum sp. SAR 10_77]KAJ4996944.1 Chitotriosidase-1 [Colletotrichum sp. SAR 10_66]
MGLAFYGRAFQLADKKTGVKYITWNIDEWVSFDDKETFKQKKDLAARLGLGGYLIWAIDQDNAEMSALAAVLDREPLGDFKSIDKGDENWTGTNEMCYVSSCGVEDCKAGEIKITDQKCGGEQKSTLCCPLSGPLTQSRAPGAAARRDAATATAKTIRTVLDILDDVAKIILRVELDLDTRPEKEVEKWKNCACDNCSIHTTRVRTFCCESDGEPLVMPVDLKNLFEHPPESGSDTDYTLETDKTSADGDGDPNESAFQCVVRVSPEALQISLGKRDGSRWDVFDCHDSISSGERTARMVCNDHTPGSNYHKMGLGHSVPGTILQMRRGCGPGKYAVSKGMAPALGRDHAKLLPRHLSHLAGLEPVVCASTTAIRTTTASPVPSAGSVTYEKKKVFLNLPFPGASFKIPDIATIGPQLTVEGSIDASLGMAGLIKTKLEIAKWEVRQVLANASAYKRDLINNSKPSLNQTGDFSGIQKPKFYAGVTLYSL